MSNFEVVEKLWDTAGFTVNIVKLPLDVVTDRLALLSDGSGKISSSRYDQFLLNNCVIDGEKIYLYLESMEGEPDKIIQSAIELRTIVIEVNPFLDPELLIFNNENIIKIPEQSDKSEDTRRIVENADWDKPDFEGVSDEDMDEFFKSLPPPLSFDGAGGYMGVDKILPIMWDAPDQLIIMILHDSDDVPDIFKDRTDFPDKAAYKRFIITRCIHEFKHLFAQIDMKGYTQKAGGPDKVVDELYEICMEYNSFLSWEQLDLDKVKRAVKRKYGNSKKNQNKFRKDDKDQVKSKKSGGRPETDEFREFEDLTEEEILSLDSRIKEWVIGQDEAVSKITESIQLASCGLKEVNTPIGVYMLTGETGVGKSYLAKMLSQEMCGSEFNIIRVDCSEYSQPHEVSKLIGSPSGYVGYDDGGYLTNSLAKNPFSVVLFDEIEKAHPKLHNILLQVMDEGRLTSNKGETVSFGQTVVLMTSNVGVKEVGNISKRVGMGSVSNLTQAKREKAIGEALKNKFKPEFLNRLDGVITFNSLSKEHGLKIIDIAFRVLNVWLEEKNMTVEYTKEAAEFLYTKGFIPGFGARPLKREMKKRILLPISKMMLNEKKRSDCRVKVGIKDGELTFVSSDLKKELSK